MMTVVPILRIAPTDGNIPLRTFHSRAHSPGSVEKRTSPASGSAASAVSIARICSASATRSRRARFDEQRRAVGAERSDALRQARLALDRAQRRAVGELDRGHRRALEQRDGAARGLEIVEQDQRARLVGVVGDGRVGDLADESERAFGADHQMREHVDRVVEIDQRVQAVAGRVLHPELVADPRRERFVAARRAGERVERADELGLRARETRRGSPDRGCRAPCRSRERRAARRACGSCSARCRSTFRSRCWRRCRRSSPRRSTPGRGRSCGRSSRAGDWRRRRSRRVAARSSRARGPTSARRQPSPSSTSTESLIAWPERLVPAARNVTGVREAARNRRAAARLRPRCRRRRRSAARAGRSSHRCPRSGAAADR